MYNFKTSMVQIVQKIFLPEYLNFTNVIVAFVLKLDMGPTLCCEFEKLISALKLFPKEMKIRQWKEEKKT